MSSPTISMTPFRMYARLYAGLYLYEKNELCYSFGATKFWFQILFYIQIFDKNFLRFMFSQKFLKLVSRSTYRDAKVWIQTIRSPKNTKKSLRIRGHLIRSDIKGNYPILIGIKNSIETISMDSSVGRLESRTANPILLSDITHIEVPLANVEETEEFLASKNIQLKVIPFEYGEMYCSSVELKELVGAR